MIRKRLEASMLMLAVAVGACGDDGGETEEVETEAEGPAQAAATESAEPGLDPAALLSSILGRLGGATMVAGNSLVVEVLPRASGELEGLVYDADGAVVEGAKLTVTAKGADGSAKTVDLQWDAEAEVYVGTAREDEDAELDLLATGPMEVEVEVEGADEPATGQAEVVAVAPTPVYGGDVLVAGDVAAELVALPSGDIQLIAYGPDGLLTGDAAELKVEVPDSEGEGHEVDLVWNADTSAYLGSVEEGVALDTGAVTLSASLRGAPPRRARVARAPIRVPAHEGDVVVVGGGMSAELVPKEDGRIHAYVVDRDGDAIDADADVSFAFGGAIDPIPAEWDADAGAYVAVIPPAIDVSATPMRVRVRRGGRTHRGAIAVPAGRALGVAWRARVEAGQGGAIPPGQARAVLPGQDIRVRVRGGGRGRTVMVGAMAPETAPGATVMVRGDVAERVRGAAVRARGAAVMVNVRAPMVDVRAPGATVMTSGRPGGMSSAMVRTRRREGGASVMAGVMVSFGN